MRFPPFILSALWLSIYRVCFITCELPQAKQREKMLEMAVSEAQTSEKRITNLHNWIARVEDVLKEHEDNDTTMDDLPHDFQVTWNRMFFFWLA